MADTLSPKHRSALMSRIRGKDTGPEKLVRSLLHRMGYRFRLHVADLPGRPDIVLPRHRKVVLVNGCLWHGHCGCRRATIPKSRRRYWEAKIAANQDRDRRVLRALRRLGWHPLVIWQCKTRNPEALKRRLAAALAAWR